MKRSVLALRGFVMLVPLVAVFALVTPGTSQACPHQECQPHSVDVPVAVPVPGQPLPAYPRSSVQEAETRQTILAPSNPPHGIDLDVTYINRSPMYKAYCVQYPDGLPSLCTGTTSEQRWPSPGEIVTFTAHIANKGTLASGAFECAWALDGNVVQVDTLPGLAPGEETTTTYAWPWAHTMDGERVLDNHTIGLIADPAGAIDETYETNNQIVDRTNALALRLAISPAMVESYNTPWNPAFSYSAEDWLQRQIAAMNWAQSTSAYAWIPPESREQVRINSIEVVPNAPTWQRFNDGGWFVNADYRLVSGGYDPVSDIDWSLVHELSHQIGLIDLYNLNLATTSVLVRDREGIPVNMGFDWPRPDLMGGGDITPYTDPHLYSSHSAGGLASTKGYRRGYYGEYQYDVPTHSYLKILDNQGLPASDVEITLYQRTGPYDWAGDLHLDDTPEISGTTNAQGILELTSRSAAGGTQTRTGHILQQNPFGVIDVVGRENRFLIELRKDDHQEFHWTDITAFNLAYWQGNIISHTFLISSHVPSVSAPTAPERITTSIEGDQATICWSPVMAPDLEGYYVYRAAPPVFSYERISTAEPEGCYVDTHDQTCLYAVTAVDSAGRESGFSHFAWAPNLRNPISMALMGNGQHVILDPQNGYALLQQNREGRYLHNIGSPHYHLEFSDYVGSDALERLLLNHPGDAYQGRHSVRIADAEANPVLEFGQRGSQTGEFETPAGVASVGEPLRIDTPYSGDGETLLLLHFDQSYEGANGETGTASGTSFAAARFDQGVWVDSGDTLTYDRAGNVQPYQGAVEFWVRPAWDGADNASHVFFEVGAAWFNRMRVMKDGANNLRFMVWTSDHEYGVATHVGHWQAGEWHHVAALWQDGQMDLVVDAELKAQRNDVFLPDSLAGNIYIGSSLWHDQEAQALIDEVRISSTPRFGLSSSPPYRILVSDQYNHRVQAFDELGNWITSFGEFGSADGRFNQPSGLAVTLEGQVIVADRGNSRLQVLSFDGNQFAFLDTIEAGLNQPTGVSVYGPNRILVADTGDDEVVILDTSGIQVAAYTQPNGAEYRGAFSQPRSAIGQCGDIVVADTGNRRITPIAQSLPPLPAFTSSSTSGAAPLTVTFTNTTCGENLTYEWAFGDGLTSTLPCPAHKFPWPGTYTVGLTAQGPGGTGAVEKVGYVTVGRSSGLHLPLVLKRFLPPPTPEPPACYPDKHRTAPTGSGPQGIAIAPSRGLVFVANQDDDTVSVLNSTSLAPAATIDVQNSPQSIAYNPTNEHIYVTNHQSGTVTVVNASSLAVLSKVSVGSLPNGICADPARNRLVVANYGDGTVSVLDGRTDVVSQTIPVGLEPAHIAINDDNGKAYITLHGEQAIVALGANGNLTRINIDSASPYGITIDSARNLVYVATIDQGRIVVVDSASDTLLGWATIQRSSDGAPVPLRMIAVNSAIGTSGHLFATTVSADGGWDRLLIISKGWEEYFAQPYALEVSEAREGLVVEPSAQQIWLTSNSGQTIHSLIDGEPICPVNFALSQQYEIHVKSIKVPAGTQP